MPATQENASADALSVGLLACRGGRIVWANRAFQALVEAPGESLVGRSADEWFSDAGDGIPDWSAGERGAGGPPDAPLECRLRSEIGGARRVEVRRLGEGLWEVRDVSTRAGLRAELGRLQAELLEARRELEETRRCLHREAQEREELLAVVSHELRTPITVIAGFTRLLLQQGMADFGEEQRHFLEQIRASCDRLNRFAGSLVEGDRKLAGSLQVHPRDGSLAAVISGVATFLKPLLDERRQQLVLDLTPGARHARFDAQPLEQVLINLLGNALKYGPCGSTLRLSTRPLEQSGQRWVEVAVSDQGPGIPEADRERIFEPYVRGEAPGAGGLGLGLAICRQIVEAHGGQIHVTPARGGGSRFAFTLPAAEEG